MIYFTIHSDRKISAIKEEFNTFFPFLKLEFFKRQHSSHSPSAKSDVLNSNDTIQQLHKKAIGNCVNVSEDMAVTTLEQLFQEKFGISAQVFRKSGRSWLETSVTDDWTLKRQNDEGKELSSFIRNDL